MKRLLLLIAMLQSSISPGRGNGAFSSAPPPPLVTPLYTGQECDSANTYASSLSCSITPTGAGHLLLIWIADHDAGTTSVSPSSSAGGTPSLAVTCPAWAGGGNSGALYYIKNASGGSQTITASYSGATYASYLMVLDISGASATSPIDATACAQNNTGTSPANSGMLTTANAADLLVGLFSTDPPSGGSIVGPAGSGFTLIPATNIGGPQVAGEYKPLASAGSYAATASVGYTPWVAAAVALK